MEGRSKASAGAASVLPDDPLLEILSRVPAKSVCRFKCVSKAWRDLIADPHNRKKLRQPVQGLFVEAAEIDEVDDTTVVGISFGFIDLMARSVPLGIDPSLSFLREMIGIGTFILDSCNGLILFGHKEPSGPLHYTVCNPTTKQWSAVPGCGSRHGISHTYLAFDPAISSHFHLVKLHMPYENAIVASYADDEIVSLHVYSSEAGTWSQNQIDEQKGEQGQFKGWLHQFTRHCAFVNGFLHLLLCGSDRYHILAVDVQGKARRVITVPDVVDRRPWHPYVCYLGQSQGYLHCVIQEFAHNRYEKLSIWVLQDYDTQEWVCKSTVNYLDVFGETDGIIYFEVVGIHQDCNVIFFFHQVFSCDLMSYDMDRKEVSVIATFEEDTLRRDFIQYIPCFSESPALTHKH